jgi:hypothetical protein
VAALCQLSLDEAALRLKAAERSFRSSVRACAATTVAPPRVEESKSLSLFLELLAKLRVA